jgi:aryl-alcohol dehydrogenase-like predicted oxidoreductase
MSFRGLGEFAPVAADDAREYSILYCQRGLVIEATTLNDATVGTVDIAGKTVRRLGFGAMRISGARNTQGVRDREVARNLIRRVVDRGVNLIDTANIYGYGESEEIIAEALHPYPADLLITTKAGFKPGKISPGETSLPPLGTPEHIREECEKSLRRLRVDAIDLYQVHVPDPPFHMRTPSAPSPTSSMRERSAISACPT